MKKLFLSIFLFVIISLFSTGTVVALAQADVSSAGNSLSLAVYPSQPGPNQNIEVDAESYGVNLDTVKITWVVNGKVVASGVGIKSINTTTGVLGSKTTISMTAATPIGNISKTISLQSASVYLSWEGLTYVPNFYKGQPLPSSKSSVKLVAFPDIMKGATKVSDNALVYTWKVNGSVMGDSSGYGKNYFIYKYPLISRPATIEVVASLPDQTISAKTSVSISPSDTKVLVYEDNPILGLLTNTAIANTFSLSNEEVRMVAVPYFFTAESRSDLGLNYKWVVGGNPVPGSADDPSALVLRPDKGASGNADISVGVNQNNIILQAASTVFNIVFGQVKK